MTADRWIAHEHAGTGVRIRCPGSWEVTRDPGPGLALVVVEPDHGEGFRANVVVTVEELAAGTDLRAWQRDVDARLPETLPGYVLLDLERVEVAGLPGARRLAHYAAPGPEAVTQQQWATVVPGRDFVEGCTVTASVATLAYASLVEELTRMAQSLALRDDHAAGKV